MRQINYHYVIPIFLALAVLGVNAAPALADFTVTGTFQYEDRDFTINGFTGAKRLRPIRYADVQILSAGTVLATGATDLNGNFSVAVPGSPPQSLNARCVATATVKPGLLLDVRRLNNQGTTISDSFGSLWYLDSSTISGTLNVGVTTAYSNSDSGSVFNVWDVLVDGAEFVSAVTGSFPTEKITAVWSSGHAAQQSYYAGPSSAANLTKKYIFVGAGYDDTVIYHEFGHFVADLYSKLDAPVTSADGYLPIFGDGNQDIRIAWAEGVGMFIGASIRQFKGYSQPEIYVVTDGTNLVRSFEIHSLTSPASSPLILRNTKGSANMVAVCSSLWNITSGPVLQRPFSDVWKVLAFMKTITSPGISVERFWDGWFSPSVNNGDAAAMQTVFSTLNGIEYIADAQEPDNSPAQAPTLTPLVVPTPSSGPHVLINEVSNDGAVELYNAGDADADLTGWIVSASRAGFVTANLTLPSLKLKSGGFLTLRGSTGSASTWVFYFGTTLPWADNSGGACSLRDSSGAGIDFVRWGDSAELPPFPTKFSTSGSNPPPPPPGKSLGRDFAGTDTDSANDWTVNSPTFGTFNISGEEKHHTFYPAGDVDYVAFNALAGKSYLIETLNLANAADTVLDLLAADGATLLATNDDSGTTLASRFIWSPSATGKYFLRSHRYDKPLNLARYGSYDLRITESASAFNVQQPETLTVSAPGQGGKYDSISDALAAASNGDTIQIVDNGTYAENLKIIGRSITLRAAGGTRPTIDASGTASASGININAKAVRIEALTIRGGAVGVVLSAGNATIVNTVVTGASNSPSSADGIEVVGSNSTAAIVNCTVVNNKRLGIGVFSNGTARIANSIAWGNSTADISGDSTAQAGLTVKNTLSVKSNYTTSNGNVTGDPAFVNAASGDYHLQSSSPAVDKGDPHDPDLPSTDADGIPRNLGTAPDMGAYEYLPPNILTSMAVFPQIAVGGTSPAYRTALVGVNAGTQASTVQVALVKDDGSPFPVTVLGAGGATYAMSASSSDGVADYPRTGNAFNVPVPPSGTIRLETAVTGALSAGYAKLLSNLPIDGTALFKSIGSSRILSEAGVGLSRQTQKFTVYIDNKNNAYSGLAVANAGTVTATLTMTLHDSQGNTLEVKSRQLAAGQHFARFAADADMFPNTAPANFEGSIEFTSDHPVAAVALRYDNTNLGSLSQVFSTIPVLLDEAAATTLYFPQVADGGSYRTNFILVNPSTTATAAKLEFFGDDGSPLSLSIGGVPVTSYRLNLSAKGVARLITDGTAGGTKVGWVRVTSPVAIGGSAIFQTLQGAVITSEAGVASSPSANRFTTYVESLGSALSGLAICNPNSSTITATLKLRDAMGTQVGSTSFNLAPLGHSARFFEQWLGDFPDFQGTLEVSTSSPVSGVALRYDNPPELGQVFATLPVIVIQ